MMKRKEPLHAIVATIAVCGLLMPAQHHGVAQAGQKYSVASRTVSPGTSKGLAAMDAAASDGKYLFLFFWKASDAHSRKMGGVFQSTMNKWAESTNSISVKITDRNEKAVVDKLGVSRAPMPLVVALAPNGAVTKAFPIKFTEQDLLQGFVSPCTAKCMKALQNRKLVLLSVHNQYTQLSQIALQGIQDFKADARFSQATELITVDPDDSAEVSFLQKLQVDPRTPTAVTILLAPTGQSVAKFVGAVTKEQIVAKVQAGPCAGGKCGPGGCCPK